MEDEMRTDSERLDWLEGETTDGPLMNWYVALCEEHGGEAGDLREAIDAAIDAALADAGGDDTNKEATCR